MYSLSCRSHFIIFVSIVSDCIRSCLTNWASFVKRRLACCPNRTRALMNWLMDGNNIAGGGLPWMCQFRGTLCSSIFFPFRLESLQNKNSRKQYAKTETRDGVFVDCLVFQSISHLEERPLSSANTLSCRLVAERSLFRRFPPICIRHVAFFSRVPTLSVSLLFRSQEAITTYANGTVSVF